MRGLSTASLSRAHSRVPGARKCGASVSRAPRRERAGVACCALSAIEGRRLAERARALPTLIAERAARCRACSEDTRVRIRVDAGELVAEGSPCLLLPLLLLLEMALLRLAGDHAVRADEEGLTYVRRPRCSTCRDYHASAAARTSLPKSGRCCRERCRASLSASPRTDGRRRCPCRSGRQKGSRRALIDAVAALAVQVISRSCAELTDAVAVPLQYGSSAGLAPCRLVPLTSL